MAKKRTLFYLGISLSLLVGCAPKKVRKPVYPTNVELIASSIDKIEIPEWAFKAGEKVAIQSIEWPEPQDSPLDYLIQDQLMRRLYKLKTMPVERDKEILHTLFAESGHKYTYYPKIYIDSIAKKIKTPLKTADKIFSYRVMECGINYVAGEQKAKGGCCLGGTSGGGSPTMERRAYTSLSCRVTSAKTSRILWAGTLSGLKKDVVPITDLPQLEDMGLRFYAHGLPNIWLIEKLRKKKGVSEAEAAEAVKILPIGKAEWRGTNQHLFTGFSHGWRFGLDTGSRTNMIAFFSRISGEFSGGDLTIPASIGLRINGGALETIGAMGLNPSLDVGFGYYLGRYEHEYRYEYYDEYYDEYRYRYGYDKEWNFTTFGWSLGLEVEYSLGNLTIGLGDRIHILFGEDSYNDFYISIGY